MKGSLLAELETTRLVFHYLLDSLSDQDLQRTSRNAAWTNQQILFHMAFGFFLLPSLVVIALIFGRLPTAYSKQFAALLNSVTGPFNAINALGPQGGGRVMGRRGLSQAFDGVYAIIVTMAQMLPEGEWARGMHYPTRWDPLFYDYMTLADVFRFPMRHFYYHTGHIARSPNLIS